MGLLQQQGYTSLGGKGATSGGGGLLQQQGFTSLAEASKPSVTVTKKVTTTAPVQKSTVSTPLEGARKALEAFGSNVQKAAQSAQKTIGGLTVKLTAPSKQQEQIQQKAQALPKTLIIKPGQTKIDPIQLKQAGLSATLTPQAQQQARETPSKIVNDLNTLNQKAGPLIYNQENLMSSAGLASEQQKSAMAENPKLKLTATALLAGFIEDSMNALLPMSGGTVGVGRNILKEGPNIVAGAKGALVASGLTALVSKMKGEDLDMQSLLINGGIGAVIGASEPHVSVGGKKIDLLGAEKTLKDFGFSKADLSNPTSLKAKFNEYVKANHPDVLGGKGGESFAEFNNAYSKEYAKTVEAFNKMTSAGIDPSWSLKDVQLWIKNLWRGKKTPEQLAQAVESSKTKLTDLAEAKQGKPTIDTIIPPGEHTPQQVIGKVVSSGLEKTTAGKELVKTALEAQKTGQNIVIEAPVTAPSKEVATETPSDVATTLRQAKGLSAEDIIKQHPDLNLKRDVPVTDIYGKKSVIDAGEALTPYELKGNKVLLKDGETYIVSKNQYQNIKGQSVSGEAKPFAPELARTEETVKGDQLLRNKLREKGYDLTTNENGGRVFTKGDKTFSHYSMLPEDIQQLLKKESDTANTKFSQYTLPDGKNYKEILIKAPAEPRTDVSLEDFIKQYNKRFPGTGRTPEEIKVFYDQGNVIPETGRMTSIDKKVGFKSSHWDEPNVLAHLRINERTYKGKKVTFMEELQSDWAREGRKQGFTDSTKDLPITEKDGRFYVTTSQGQTVDFGTRTPAEAFARGQGDVRKQGVPNNPLLKNWQELSIKRALKEAVDNGSDYFAWINGEQTSARYNLATHLKNVEWRPQVGEKTGSRVVSLTPKDSNGKLIVYTLGDGTINEVGGRVPTDWKGKKLDEVLGKGLADKIMADETGTLSGEGLKFGGEWASTLYDKQVANIVKDLTGAKIEVIDMGLPIEKKKHEFFVKQTWDVGETAPRTGKPLTQDTLKVGKEIYQLGQGNYIITDILGKGKFLAVPKNAIQIQSVDPAQRGRLLPFDDPEVVKHKETFDISTKKAVQQGIKITPEIRALVKGEAPVLKKPSGVSPIEQKPVPETKVVEKPVQEVSVPKETVKPKDDEFISRVYKRAMEENPDLDAAGGMTKKVNFKEESEKAVKLMEEDKQKAFRVAMNAEDSPGVLNNLVNVALREKALEEGNKGLYQTLLKNASFAQTRRGQEIGSEKADIANNSTSRYVKELINSRLEILGDKYTSDIRKKLTGSKSKRGLDIIDEQVKAQKKSFVDRKMDMQRAQALIDSLICK